jgi:hypothetical protein
MNYAIYGIRTILNIFGLYVGSRAKKMQKELKKNRMSLRG